MGPWWDMVAGPGVLAMGPWAMGVCVWCNGYGITMVVMVAVVTVVTSNTMQAHAWPPDHDDSFSHDDHVPHSKVQCQRSNVTCHMTIRCDSFTQCAV